MSIHKLIQALNISKNVRKQLMMRRVLLSLIPIILFSIYLYGWRVLALLVIVTISGVITEYLFERTRKSKPSDSVLVTCFLFTLTLPITIPYWIAIVGIVFAVTFGKQVFGGFGRNVFNPALVGRCFIYISFPSFMTSNWVKPFTSFPGGFAAWMPNVVDATTQATPMTLIQLGEEVPYSMGQLIAGNIPGSIGESSVILIILAAVYLIYKKTASWQIMVSTLLGMLGIESIFLLIGISNFSNPLMSILSGGFLFAAVFMATDPVTAPSQANVKIIFGLLVGTIASIIRNFSVFPEGVMFAILIVNSFVPLMDSIAKNAKSKGKKVTI
ncbi:MAG: RnfABCDGE type electron transport complex subunit D [Clostridiales bacterium]|nr:RnfABCDGE type electron transport complex subunit D [Clostridiales bacterium]